MSGVAQFNGFTKQSTQFLADLKQHNDRVWFNEHKGEFEYYLMTPAREFVTAMGEKLRAIAPNIQADPRVDRSIFRIYRDTRFSKDKSPYKTHLAFWVWEGSKSRMENPGFYFHLEPDHLMLGTGIYTFSKETLKVYRSSVADDTHGGQLE